jgi:hypothetical protein
MPFIWHWSSDQFEETLAEPNEIHPLYIKAKVNQEIVLLRSILKHNINSPMYVIDSDAWTHDLNTVMSYNIHNHLSWRGRERLSSNPITLTPKDVDNYKDLRRKFLDITNSAMKQRIFVAMRKLALYG